MKLYMQQKVFSIRDRFAIKDEYENDKYFVEGELLSWGKKLHIYNAAGSEAAFVKQKILTFLPKFEIYVNGILSAEIVKEFTFFKPSYALRGTNWTVQGSFMQHDYQILDGEKQIAAISKAWFSWGDSFMLDVTNEQDEVLAIATALAIDCVLDEQSRRNSN